MESHLRKLYISSAIVSICGIIFEVLLGAAGSYTFGDSVKQYALTIGLFLSGMGIGSAFSERLAHALVSKFIQIELAIALVGGFSSFWLFYCLSHFDPVTAQMYLFAVTLIIGGLTGVELPILIRKANEIGLQLNKSAARILFFDYAGSLIGAVCFVIWLRPWLGLIKSAFFIGLINAGVALWLILSFRRELQRFRLLLAAGFICLVLLAAGFLLGEQLASDWEKKLYRDPVIRAFQSKYQRIIVTKAQDDLRLYLNGNLQFSSSDEYRYHEALVHPLMSSLDVRRKVLVLGGGDGLALREICKYEDVEHVTLVDLDKEMVEFSANDPLMTKLNQRSLSSSKMQLVYDDAFQFLIAQPEKYDAIIVDLPDPNNEALNKLYTSEFYRLVQSHLTENGAAGIQATSPLFATKAYWSISKTIESTGLFVNNYHAEIPSFGSWGFVLASKYPMNPNKLRIQVETKYLHNNMLPSLFHFGKDEDNDLIEEGKPFNLQINTMNRPVLLDYYYEGWRNY
ncbi:polyamine aminopropyltransferase [Paenibacillus sedimenti]|uniref:Polyamine aminopropyltransferase n=1 Tax=Paenibacillus sedimenti TaxID=2770274 RepID=A0A926KJR6_9BACL|nr:polyamine aminopropyltransferase [Paenibacillus sedimenti]MBD0378900.1 polyamine aminopropyltransferase [Paenibacillus sedimenti]